MVVKQGCDVGIDDEDDVATVPTVATIGTAEGFELLAADGNAAVPTVTGGEVEDDAVDERRDRHYGERATPPQGRR